MKKFLVKGILMLGLIVAMTSAAKAQMAQFQALYIYNFAKNIGWPAEDSQKDLVVTVIGDNDLVSELNKLAQTKKIGSRKVVVKDAATATGIQKSDIIFLGESKSSQIATLVANQKGNKTLIVSGKKGHCASGAGVSFVMNGAKLGFEISNNNITAGGLQVSQKLLTLGTEVN
ncbi:MAG: YfiR family protein [Bacteroidia bacterium]|nr:YfiR family protein [Bacteroidia bacterium]